VKRPPTPGGQGLAQLSGQRQVGEGTRQAPGSVADGEQFDSSGWSPGGANYTPLEHYFSQGS
jgi:hypothetical protein